MFGAMKQLNSTEKMEENKKVEQVEWILILKKACRKYAQLKEGKKNARAIRKVNTKIT